MEPWPQNFKPTLIGDSKFFEIDESLLVALGVKVHVKKKGFKDLNNLLEKHGKTLASVKKIRHTRCPERNWFHLEITSSLRRI